MAEWNPRANELFLAALELPDPAARRALLDRACGPDAALRRAVDTLLSAHAAAGDFLDGPAPDATADRPPSLTASAPDADRTSYQSPQEVAGAVIAGRYKLLEPIGEGGMGTVWMADQTDPVKRKVAVKLIRADRGGPSILARFAAERQAIALMDHPHIAKLLDAGTTAGGSPFFVVELVKGVPLTDYCDRHRLTVPDRLALFGQICSAVQHAHQKGIIHRDLKPTNVLVESHDGKPVSKVIDFGLAKATAGGPLTEQTLFTGFGSVLGTPLYMAPEQAAFNAVDVDTRADVYALGVILYELLTGSTPISREALKKAALDEVLRVIREEEPAAPSSRISTAEARPNIAAARQTEPARLGRFVRGELDWIVMKALSKDRDRRYESAGGFARDVERFLAREPVSAGPPTRAYRLRKFVARNKVQVTAAGLVLLALAAGVLGTTLGLVEARRQTGIARDERDAADAARKDEAAQRNAAEKASAAEAAAAELARGRLAEVERGLGLIEGAFADLDPDAETKEGRPLRDILADRFEKAAAKLDGGEVGDPRTVAKVRSTLGRSLLALGRPRAAAALFAKALAAVSGGADDPQALNCVHCLAVAYSSAGRLREAAGLLEDLLPRQEKALGADHPLTLTSVNSLALMLRRLGNPRRAEPLHRRALEGFEKAHGPDHPRTLMVVNSLAELYRDAADYRRAEPLHRRALEGFEKAHGPDHPDTLTSVNNLGLLYWEMGDYRRAEPLLVRGLAGSEKALGPDHPNTLTMVSNLSALYWSAGDPRRAEPLLVRARAGREKALGPDHPDTLTSVSDLAVSYFRTGDYWRAEPLHRRALAGFEKALGPDHPGTLESVMNLGGLLTETGRATEAVPLLERAYRRRATSPRLAATGDLLVAAHRAAGRPADAARVIGEVLAEERARLKAGSPELGGLLAQAGKRLLDLDPAAAEPVLRECLELREKLNPKAWGTSNAKSLLGGALLLRGKAAEAEPLLVAGYEGLIADRKSIPPNGAGNLPDAADRLVEVYRKLGKPDEAARWRAERAQYPPPVAPPPRPAVK